MTRISGHIELAELDADDAELKNYGTAAGNVIDLRLSGSDTGRIVLIFGYQGREAADREAIAKIRALLGEVDGMLEQRQIAAADRAAALEGKAAGQ